MRRHVSKSNAPRAGVVSHAPDVLHVVSVRGSNSLQQLLMTERESWAPGSVEGRDPRTPAHTTLPMSVQVHTLSPVFV